ncbi:MAG: Glucose-1-phosphate adenylyltransferase [Candidatus Methanofastidiosum methylothiophilum]|uniref:mannose-1-phosphate guanylyltransferase n=1 Tax=Candidatus Methanofastidiosum methylothiophilum TaxID=1705564 RepID=A0A150IYC4_9EURY|nr:MAG: Glucose-1-phosphate adenylyltransferase [Candidatus Methanofastidiosum methylthiophilus]KYC48480.1 MAG: Glucose-1-phosphate adenylyltransferase [Candidatus Methanofastidiosum methylthiophilus]KYC49922.1 MAG: Glucose-1-phosphate adenylyltransferase [Candidatus Methanofastidiosum methylthiophilus]
MAGGSGTRLWPLSRTYYPKQFLKFEDKSLFQLAYLRALKLSRPEDIVIVTNKEYEYHVINQLEELGFHKNNSLILKESVGRNTLPAITWGMQILSERDEDSIAAIFSSDHLMEDSAIDEIKKSTKLASENLVTFGIVPTHPHTGYGYISCGEKLLNGYRVKEFKEKPDDKTAEKYLKKGYLWNSGIFLFSSKVFFEELDIYQPEISRIFKSQEIDYPSINSISVDYGLLEKSKRIAVIPLDVKWSDLGSFKTLYDYMPHDDHGNSGNAKYLGSSDNLVHSERKFVALLDVNNLAIIDTSDALLVCNKNKTELVKDLTKKLKEQNDPIADFHLQVHRPWGSYTELEKNKSYKIKRVTVNPGKKLSLQLHTKRSEHWVVVSGLADITLGDKSFQLKSGESTFVPPKSKHRLGNSQKDILEIIEVQIGDYLEEDDIVRFDDDFNRV